MKKFLAVFLGCAWIIIFFLMLVGNFVDLSRPIKLVLAVLIIAAIAGSYALMFLDRCKACGGLTSLPRQPKFCEECGAALEPIRLLSWEGILRTMKWLGMGALVVGLILDLAVAVVLGGMLTVLAALIFDKVNCCPACEKPIKGAQHSFCPRCGVKLEGQD